MALAVKYEDWCVLGAGDPGAEKGEVSVQWDPWYLGLCPLSLCLGFLAFLWEQ